ncbi:MAG: retroviral-like aspartic protease family protein [Nitrospirota bacterium]|nr:retroviral-like aspartic protease family protein [Nitrospirota bacterium]MDH5588186.1 retroviral-like aspartic protease family protein [Nitrospirota bacterium]MDH5775862.1 retroviral-like aspartic protease family protein [Nitrospirota bacterium]
MTIKWTSLIMATQIVFLASPGLTAMYRCQDTSGAAILTDNPAQLTNCAKLEGSVISTPSLKIDSPQPNKRRKTPEYPNKNEIPPNSLLPQESKQDSLEETDSTIPLQKIGGSFVAQVTLNNERTAHLIVDTGASMTVLSTAIAIDLGILGTTDNELLTVNTAGGSVQVNMNYLASLQVGTAQANHVAVAIHDLPDIPEQIEGLLGMSFLKHFLVTLDAEHARLILRPKPSS